VGVIKADAISPQETSPLMHTPLHLAGLYLGRNERQGIITEREIELVADGRIAAAAEASALSVPPLSEHLASSTAGLWQLMIGYSRVGSLPFRTLRASPCCWSSTGRQYIRLEDRSNRESTARFLNLFQGSRAVSIDIHLLP
jgi:hypothetical protein